MTTASLITKKQAAALHFIAQYTDRHGYCPTLAEVCVGVGMSAASRGVMCWRADRLRKLGFLVKGKKHSQPLILTEVGRRFVKKFPAGNSRGSASDPSTPRPFARPAGGMKHNLGQRGQAGIHHHTSED